jgi:hypothetical protein
VARGGRPGWPLRDVKPYEIGAGTRETRRMAMARVLFQAAA